MPPSQFAALVTDDANPDSLNPILDHPNVRSTYANVMELGSVGGMRMMVTF